MALTDQMDPEREMIRRCLDNDSKAQEELYKLYSPVLYGICLRFAHNRMEAEDILQEGFIKIFNHLKDYRFEGHFQGWMRRTIINTAINFYKRKSKELAEVSSEKLEHYSYVDANIIESMAADELLILIQKLPEGYRMVFNLYVIEGYSHKEIAKMLNISENTSKSQLSRARASLQNMIRSSKHTKGE